MFFAELFFCSTLLGCWAGLLVVVVVVRKALMVLMYDTANRGKMIVIEVKALGRIIGGDGREI